MILEPPPDRSVEGECLCGAVRYRVDGRLRDARCCHCSRCRKAFSAQASAYALVDPDEFRWLCGDELLTTYSDQQGCGLQFCSLCGATLGGILAGVIHGVSLGCVNGNPDVVLGRHIYVGSKANWEVVPDGVVQFLEGPTGGQPP